MKPISLNVYADNSSEKPIKVYTIRRVTFKTAKAISSLTSEDKEKGKELETTIKMLRTIIPDFRDEDFDGLDPTEIGEFLRAVASAIKGVVDEAQKN